MLLIKAGEEAVYGNVIDMLDEPLINNVLKPPEEEKKYQAKEKRKEQ